MQELANIGVVLVTFNRLEKLKKALQAYDAQQCFPKYIVVINNASTDGTDEYLEEWKQKKSLFDKYVITSEENLGGSGGFYLGEKFAMDLAADWIMVTDDDAYPAEDYIWGLNQFIRQHDVTDISVLCGRVFEGRSDVNNFHREIKAGGFFISPYKFKKEVPKEEYQKDWFCADFVSYVGVAISKEKMKQAGLVNKDYFIHYDDNEHSCRLRKYGKLVCVPKYTMQHDVGEYRTERVSWMMYYNNRNFTDLLKKHFPLYAILAVGYMLLRSLLSPLKGNSLTEAVIRVSAIWDGIFGNLGKHPVYQPGWKP